MESEKKSIIDGRIKLLFEAIRDAQATIFSIDWKARTILMVNTITVPLMLGIISVYSFKKDVFQNLTLQNPIAVLLFVVAVLLLFALATVFYLTLKVISPRIRLSKKITYGLASFICVGLIEKDSDIFIIETIEKVGAAVIDAAVKDGCKYKITVKTRRIHA